ncbi:hypothetical protein F7725_027356 [Dissostichus mawsoni]|uniref:Uncharacterized protein n=1 Tax=Dissostichus mawsoni TaxID=36200 RepID=A0A7J5XER7_DISMA|nr:hypothetical protein F7725_027356 [Dissostichus mawsoni]
MVFLQLPWKGLPVRISPLLAKPGPRGQMLLYSGELGWGHSSQSTPQAEPTEQQHMSIRVFVLLPTHVRPVLSKLRPSTQSQRNEP